MNPPNMNPFDYIPTLHAIYCRMTGQTIELKRYDRERQWYEILRAGFTARDLERVIRYLQREIRHRRRNPGALKLSNLLQPDRFEEDLNLSRLKLQAPVPDPAPVPAPQSPPASDEARQQHCAKLRAFRLRFQNHGATSGNPTDQSDNSSQSPRINLK